MKAEAIKIHQEDMEMCKAISEYGRELIHEGDGILTHCNAGPLAASRYGTGLTTYELQTAGVDCTLICDTMASCFMCSTRPVRGIMRRSGALGFAHTPLVRSWVLPDSDEGLRPYTP